MDRRGKFALAFLLITVALAFTVATFTGAQTGRIGGDVPEYTIAGKDPALLGALTPNKRPDAYPNNIGPAVVDAVVSQNGSPAASTHILWLVFNQDVNPGDFQSDDIEFRLGGINGTQVILGSGLSFATHAANTAGAPWTGQYGNVLAVTGLENVNGGAVLTSADVVHLRSPERLGFKDATFFPVKFGPAITRVEVVTGGADAGTSDNLTDVVRVFFTHQISGLTNGSAATTYFSAPEFGSGAAPVIEGFTANDWHVDTRFNNNVDQGKVREGISSFRLADASVISGRRDAGAVSVESNGTPRWHCSDNEGPRVLRAGYHQRDNGDHVLTLAFSDDIKTGVISLPGTSIFTLSDGGPVTYAAVDSDDGDNVLVLTGLSGPPTTVTITDTAQITDWQENASIGGVVTVAASPIITHANWRDAGTSTVADDRINVFFDVIFDETDGADPNEDNFGFVGMDTTGHLATLPATGNQINISWIDGAGELWAQGSRIFLTATPITYNDGTDPVAVGAPDESMAWIRDGSFPWSVALANSIQDDQTDTAFVSFDEDGVGGAGDDGAYFLFYARKNAPIVGDPTWINDFVDFARPITDPSAGLEQVDLNTDVVATYRIDGGSKDTQGNILENGDDVFFAAVVVDKEGNWDPTNIFPLGRLVAGPLSPPRDVIPGDDDAIHVFGVDPSSLGPYGDAHLHYLCGDPGSGPVDADSVRVYAASGGGDNLNNVLLGSGAYNADGSWGPVELDPLAAMPPIYTLYLVSVQNTGLSAVESQEETEIINDLSFPYMVSITDPLNTRFNCYSGNDSLRLLVEVTDPFFAGDAETGTSNPLLHVWADLGDLVKSDDLDSLVLISLGANQVDDDNDWNDVGASLAQPRFNANDRRDFPEPFVDENGDGVYTPGETFLDIPATANNDYIDGTYDYGDVNLDVNDPDENGFYYLPAVFLDEADLITDPNGVVNFAVLEDLAVRINIEDSIIRSDVDDNLNFGADFDDQLEAHSGTDNWVNPLATTCPSYSLEHHVTELSTDFDFALTLDAQAPTVSEISYLERQPEWGTETGWPDRNLIRPGDRCYTMAAGEAGSFFNIVDSTLSDDDVILVALQIDTGAGFGYLDFDPAGNATDDGVPGLFEYDDDNDGAMDFEDIQVRNAAQDSTMDAEAENDGVYIVTDNIDNDNDAFFRYNPITGGYVWFNIDERDDNFIDDDGDGQVDNGTETETYTAVNDDDEDGITDGSAVAIAHDAYERINRLGASGTIWVAGFNDPGNIGNYRGSPTGANSVAYRHAGTGTVAWPNGLVYGMNSPVQGGGGAPPFTTLMTPPDGTFYGNPYELHSGIVQAMANADHHAALAGADFLGNNEFALGAPNIISAGGAVGFGPGADGTPYSSVADDALEFGFDYEAANGRNLNMRLIKALYDIEDGVQFEMRAVAFDRCYQGRQDWAVPICMTTDSTAPSADIPSDLLGDEICDVQQDGDPAQYILEAEVPVEDLADVASVTFEQWNPGAEAWETLGVDTAPPYQFLYTYPGPLSNDPPALRDTLYFRSIAADEFGNIDPKSLCDSLYTDDTLTEECFDLTVQVVDCTSPMSCLCQIGADYYPADGAFVPSESAVDLSAWFTDGDGDENTNDVTRVKFEYRAVGTQEWFPINSLTGVDDDPDVLVDVTGIKHPIIYTGPDTLKVTVTWDTRELEAGSYDLRATAFDIEGNNNAHMACVYTATVDNVGLRAYVQPCVPVSAFEDSLFANVYIHDVAVDNVMFQFKSDDVWVTVDTVGTGGEAKGDIILRAGRARYNWLKGQDVYPLAMLPVAPGVNTTADYGNFTMYAFYDVDGDGYNPVDPVVGYYDYYDKAGVSSAAEYEWEVVIETGIMIPYEAELSYFADDEYYVDVDGDGMLTDWDWILKDNPADGADMDLNLWCTSWDITGLNGCFDVRAVATDVLGNEDNDDDSPIWTEECCVDSDLPVFCVTHFVGAAGDTVEITSAPECDWVASQDSLTFLAGVTSGDASTVDSVQFQVSRDNGFTWETFGTDMYGPDFSAVFQYHEEDLISDLAYNFRAVSWKGGFMDQDPNRCKVCLVLGENQGPETDIVEIVTTEGDRLDANTVLRGDADPLCLDDTSLFFIVQAEDNAAIENVWIMYRKVAGLEPGDVTEWAKLTDAITPVEDDTYPYEFNWDISGLTDGVYQFFPRAVDANGNVTPTFGNPYTFAMATATANVVAVEKNGADVSSLTPGEEVVIKGELDDPSDNTGVAVWFSYAERIEGEELELTTDVPFMASTSTTLYSDSEMHEAGSETIYRNGTPLEYGTDYTLGGAYEDGTQIDFVDAPEDDDVYTIDYNVSVCSWINQGDDESPYSVAWDADSGQLVPMPTPNLGTTHYDITASAQRIYRGDDGQAYYSCIEDCVSEGFVLPLNDTEAPEFAIHGLLCQFEDSTFWNATGNALCQTCGGTDSREVGDFGSCKCKLSGIEHQVFVTGDDDIVSVTMSVGGDAPIDFDWYDAEEDTNITIPITFNIDDLADVTANGWDGKAVNPDSVENVTITITEDGTNDDYAGVYNVEMTYVGDGWYRYDAVLPIPEGGSYVYEYMFAVDFVGDDQWSGYDPRWSNSTILIPAEFWCFSTEDPAATWGGVNDLNQVAFTVTDDEGNVSNNLMSGGDPGQLWITYDPTSSPIKSIWLSADVVGPEDHIEINIEAPDVTNDADIIRLEGVIVQVSVDDTNTRWRTIFTDFVNQDHVDGIDKGLALGDDKDGFNIDGGWGGSFYLPSWMVPDDDGIDNDRDGETDEADEEVYTYGLRVVTVDDCYNYCYSCGHPRATDPEVCSAITVDASLPQACLDAPVDGQVVTLGDDVTLVASTTNDDVDYVLFQYSTDSGATWNDIDATPLNDDDDPWVSSPEEDGTYTATWNTEFFSRELATDFFVSLRSMAVDHVGNEQGDDSELDCNVNIIINDQTGPTAWIQTLDGCFGSKRPWDPTLALSGWVDVEGYANGYNALDVATVVLQISADGTDWETIGFDNEMPYEDRGPDRGAEFSIAWDTDLYAEGDWMIRVYATDADGNVQNDEDGDGMSDELVALTVRVDHTAPEPVLVRVGPEGVQDSVLEDGDLIRADMLEYELGICPDGNEEITFQAWTVDADADVEYIDSMWLEFLDDVSTTENPTWRSISGYEGVGDFEYRDFLGNDENPDGKWVMVAHGVYYIHEAMESAAGQRLPNKEYRFRVRGEDYACNTNEDGEGFLLRIDAFSPRVANIYAGDYNTEGGVYPVQVAGGDIVHLTAHIRDFANNDYPDDGGPDDQHFEQESSGIYAVQFAYRNVASDDDPIILGLGTYDDGGTPGAGAEFAIDDLWSIDWTTPMNMAGTTDSLYTIYVEVRDNAGNCGDDSEEGLVSVQDVTPPEDTKLIAVIGNEGCGWQESGQGTRGTTYPFTFISELDEGAGPFGDAMGIDEAVLSQDLTGTDKLGTVSNEVDLVAAVPAGDASMLSVSPWITDGNVSLQPDNSTLYQAAVWFEGSVNGGDWMLIGEGSCEMNCGEPKPKATGVTETALSYQGPIFAVTWDTEAQAADGSYLWFDPNEDGTSVQIRVVARDVWGNVETVIDDALYHLVVDNTAPTMTVSLHDEATAAVLTEVERNNPNGLLILASGGDPSVFVNDDLVAEFHYKLSTDLDDEASWRMLEGGSDGDGFHPAWDNPDFNRPYSFHWDTNGFRDSDGDPLIPNESYDVGVRVWDLVCNYTDVVGTAKAGSAGTVKFIDTIAPQATITEVDRDYNEDYCYPGDSNPDGGDIEGDDIQYPQDIAINGVHNVKARILDGSLDTQDVRFYYRATGTQAWTLADGDVQLKDLDDHQSWYLYDWSTAPLTDGGNYEMAAVATDDAGNTDADPAIMRFVIDRTGLDFTAVTPVSDAILVPENLVDDDPFADAFDECDPDERVADIIVTADDTDVIYENSWANCLAFEWKESDEEDVEERWNSFEGMVLYDGNTGNYSTTVEMLDVFGDGADMLVDWRVVATDWAGNVTKTTFATKTIVDNEDPDLEITFFSVDGDEDTTIDAIDNGQITDVSHGDQVVIYATAGDDEDDLPATHETGVEEVQFFVRHSSDDDWSFLGTAGYDAERDLYHVTWNTTGLTSTGSDVDVYYITAFATDEAANCGEAHEEIEVHVTNQAVPLAQMSAFNPDLLSVITKGTNDRVYGLTFGEKEASTVFFQYRAVGASEWTTIGVGEYTGETLDSRQPSLIDQDLWYSQVRTSDWSEENQLEFRAVATNPLDDGNQIKPDDGGMALTNVPGQGGARKAADDGIFSGLYDLENTPVLRVDVERMYDGSTMLTPSDDFGYIDHVEFFTAGCLFLGRVEVDMNDDMLNLAPFVVMVGEDGYGAIDEFIPEMVRKADDKSVWVSDDQVDNSSGDIMDIDPTSGALVTVYASAHVKRTTVEGDAPRTEMKQRTHVFHQVDPQSGSKGAAGIDGDSTPAEDGYPTDAFTVEVSPGAVTARSGLVLTRTGRPTTPANQEENIEVIGTTYEVYMVDEGFVPQAVSFATGREAMLTIRYNEDDLGEMSEDNLTLRTFGGGSWGVAGITHVQVDTEANVITAKLRMVNGCGESGATTISVASLEKSPFSVQTSPEWNGWTDQDPIIRGLIDLDGSNLGDRFEMFIDGEVAVVATGNLDHSDAAGVTGAAHDAWFLYPGSEISFQYLPDDRLAWEYHHTCNDFDAFKTGEHTIQVGISVESEDHGLVMSPEMTFLVDAEAPYVILHGGFVGNPRLNTAAAYVNLQQDVLTVELFDPESGVLVREDRIRDYMNNDGTDMCTYGWEDADVDVGDADDSDLCELEWVHCEHLNQTDGSFKYDVWVVRDSQEDQGVPDEIEDRTLIYTGTADAVAPYADPPLNEYTPADTLSLPLAVLTGGSLIEDGTVLEISVYSDRLMFGGPLEWDEGVIDDIETLRIFLETIGVEVTFNDETGFYMAYMNGVMDCVWNSGSKYVEQRFIVDQTAPGVTPTVPGVACGDDEDPAATAQVTEYVFSAVWSDAGAGVDPNTVEVNVVGPEDVNTEVTATETTLTVKITSKTEGALLSAGTYTIGVAGRDFTGNVFATNCRFALGSTTVGVAGGQVTPNPYNPAAGDAAIQFELSKSSHVTIRAYDWAGDLVGEIFNGTMNGGPQSVSWSAQTDDGTMLSNGVYFLRIVADDGTRQEPRIVKVAVWNER